MQKEFLQSINTMNTHYVNLLVGCLRDEHHYPKCAIRTNIYKYEGNEYGRVEVLSGDYIIQAFVLMSEEHCNKLDKFPFYRTYSQWNDSGKLTPPACNVAVYNDKTGKWDIHSSSDLKHEITSPEFLNYKKACERFKARLQFVGNERLKKAVTWKSSISVVFVIAYIVTHILSINDSLFGYIIPMNTEMITILVLVVILLLLPQIIPYLKVKYNGLSLELGQDY